VTKGGEREGVGEKGRELMMQEHHQQMQVKDN
jgi:hypothetical protein